MHSRLSIIYANMKQRCYNPNTKQFKNYGGRGITICEEWNDKAWSGTKHLSKGYVAFRDWALTHGYADNLTIDRIDVNGNYEPSNCRWITRTDQSYNKRTNNIITYKGKTQTVTEWLNELNISRHAFYDRLIKGKTVEEALQEIKYSARMIEYKGKVQSMKQWFKELDLPYNRIKQRISKYHWTVERAFEYK